MEMRGGKGLFGKLSLPLENSWLRHCFLSFQKKNECLKFIARNGNAPSTCIRFCLRTQLFLCGLTFRPHVSRETKHTYYRTYQFFLLFLVPGGLMKSSSLCKLVFIVLCLGTTFLLFVTWPQTLTDLRSIYYRDDLGKC